MLSNLPEKATESFFLVEKRLTRRGIGALGHEPLNSDSLHEKTMYKNISHCLKGVPA
jgi:hypothetical protein